MVIAAKTNLNQFSHLLNGCSRHLKIFINCHAQLGLYSPHNTEIYTFSNHLLMFFNIYRKNLTKLSKIREMKKNPKFCQKFSKCRVKKALHGTKMMTFLRNSPKSISFHELSKINAIKKKLKKKLFFL